MIQNWLVVTEMNEHEGESWNYYVLGNSEHSDIIYELTQLIDQHEKDCENEETEPYWKYCWIDNLTTKTIDALPANTGYRAEHTAYPKLVAERFLAGLRKNKLDALYKGQLFDDCKAP